MLIMIAVMLRTIMVKMIVTIVIMITILRI